MRKKLMALMLIFGTLAPVGLRANEITVIIDGAPVDFVDQTPINVDGRTLVPMRGVFEALGFYVYWHQPTQTAILTDDDFTIFITIGSDTLVVNCKEIALDVPAQIIGGKTMLQIRMVLESAGYSAGWDATARAVNINSGEPWQIAYAALLRKYAIHNIGEYRYWPFTDGGSDGLFTLHDINKDSVPELIIWASSQGGYFSAYVAYTFADGEIVPLEIIGGFGGRGPSLFTPPNNREGLITTSSGSGYDAFALIIIEGHALSVQVRAFED